MPEVNEILEPNEVFYTIRDKADSYDENQYPLMEAENKLVYAKKVKNKASGVYRYYIRMNQYGRLFNPLGMYDEHSQNRSAARRAEIKYKEVDKKTFIFYIDYLRTKNKAYFLNAERGV